MSSGGALGHVPAGLRDDDLRNPRPDTGDLVEPFQDRKLYYRTITALVDTGWQQSADQPIDDDRDLVDLGVEDVDLPKQDGGDRGVVVVEAAVQRLGQGGTFDPQFAHGQFGQSAGIAFTGDQASIIARPDRPRKLVATVDRFDQCVFQQFVQAQLVAGPVGDQVVAQPGVVPNVRIGFAGTNEGRSIPRSLSLASQTASSLSVFGRPGTCLTSLALTSHTATPCASRM